MLRSMLVSAARKAPRETGGLAEILEFGELLSKEVKDLCVHNLLHTKVCTYT